MKMVDYVVDGGEGEEEIFHTKNQAIRRAKQIAKEKHEAIRIYRWARADKWSDMEIDEGFNLIVKEEA